MTDEAFKAHLAAALDNAIEQERERKDAFHNAMDKVHQEEKEAMRPIIEALGALEDRCRVYGLSIEVYEESIARITSADAELVVRRSITWSPPKSLDAFWIQESTDLANRDDVLEKEVSSADEVIGEVLDFIARCVNGYGGKG